MAEHGIAPIDLVVVNLYPFEATVARGAAYDECIENIDIGGPAMIRAAAKNHDCRHRRRRSRRTTRRVLAEIDAHDGAHDAGAAPRSSRPRPIARTAAYDAAIAQLVRRAELGETLPAAARVRRHGARRRCATARTRTSRRRFYVRRQPAPGVATARAAPGQGALLQQHQRHRRGVRAASPSSTRRPAVVIIKHANPCGVAVGADARARPI